MLVKSCVSRQLYLNILFLENEFWGLDYWKNSMIFYEFLILSWLYNDYSFLNCTNHIYSLENLMLVDKQSNVTLCWCLGWPSVKPQQKCWLNILSQQSLSSFTVTCLCFRTVLQVCNLVLNRHFYCILRQQYPTFSGVSWSFFLVCKWAFFHFVIYKTSYGSTWSRYGTRCLLWVKVPC